jgi:branched-chain amino acid transport system substrate-binding protein
MKLIPAILAASMLGAGPAFAADPIRIGVTTILSGSTADKGQSEQYGVELALSGVNQAGGVLGRPVVAFYGDNAATPAVGEKAVHRLIEDVHVPVLLGAIATPVTHAIIPIAQAAKIPLVVDISGGQDFVDASGVGGNPYLFKTIPSNLDIARGMVGWMKGQGAKKLAIVADDAPLNRVNAAMFAKAAQEAGLATVANEVIPKGTTDLAPLLATLKTQGPDHIVPVLGASTAAFFRAYEQAGWAVPVDGRVDLPGAIAAVTPDFVAKGGLDGVASIVVFTPLDQTPGVKGFVAAYRERYGIMPTQRSFFAYEATLLVVDAIRRAGSDKPADIQAALVTSSMPSLLGGTYKMDDHNHPHTPMQLLGVRGGKVAVIGTVGAE